MEREESETLINDYIDKFDKMPPIPETADLQNDGFCMLLKKAIESGKEVTVEEVDRVFRTDPLNIYDAKY